jgi:hypothetical protein
MIQYHSILYLIILSSSIVACPSGCGSTLQPQRGYCNTSSLVCICLDGFEGPSCSDRSCPKGPTWFGMPEPPTAASAAAHPRAVEVCSNRGFCSSLTGSCICDSDFDGDACERSRCPVGELTIEDLLQAEEKRIAPCSGHGRCISMRNAGQNVRGFSGSRASIVPQRSSVRYANSRSEIATKTNAAGDDSYFSPNYMGSQAFQVDYNEWEADRLFGCVCDEGFIGPACEERTCPLGTDPLFRGKPDTQSLTVQLPISEQRLKYHLQSTREVQRIRIQATGGTSSGVYGRGGTADVDEVQKVLFESVGARPFGSFTLSLDCRPENTFQTYFGDLYTGAQDDEPPPSPSPTTSRISIQSLYNSTTNLTLNTTTNSTNSTNTSSHTATTILLQPGCLHWGKSRRILSVSPAIQFPSNVSLSATDVSDLLSDSIKVALESFPNINVPNQVSVSASAQNLTSENAFRFEFIIVFSGDKVGGNLPQMNLDASGVFAGAGGSMMRSSITTVSDGSDIRGFLNISWDDRESVPNSGSLYDVMKNCTTDKEDARPLMSMGLRSTIVPIGSDPIEYSDAIMRLVFGCPLAPAPIWRTLEGNASDTNWGTYLSATDFASALTASHCTEPPPMPWDAASDDEVNNFPAIKVEMRNMIEGGPDSELTISFLRGIRTRGDVAPLRVTSSSLQLHSPSVKIASGGVSITVEEVVKGEFIDPRSSWNFAVPFTTRDGTISYSLPLGPFPWCVDASYVEAKISSMDFLGNGLIKVSRTRWIPKSLPSSMSGRNESSLNVTIDDATSEWRGEYKWMITFLSLAEDVPLVSTAVDDTSLFLHGGNSLISGSGGSLVVRKEQSGGPDVPTSEVQLIDCICPLEGLTLANGTVIPAYLSGGCSSPSLHFIRLSFRNSITDPIPYSATAEQVRLALAALPTIPDVIVRMYDQESILYRRDHNSASQLCDSDGVTTAITFAWNPGPQEALVVSEYSLPERAELDVSRAPSIGRFGGRARSGTHRLEPCSGRGACSAKTGECECYGDGTLSMFTASDNAVWPDATPGTLGADLERAFTPRASDVVPPSEIIRNCGTPTPPVTKCPGVTLGLAGSTSMLAPGVKLVILLGGGGEGECNTHGVCTGPPFFNCICDSGFTGPACELDVRQCALGPAWFDVPERKGETFNSFRDISARRESHKLQRCSSRGNCVEGKCSCIGRWAGRACELSPCPAAELQPPSPLVTPALMRLSTRDYRKASQSNDCGNKMPCVTMNILARGVTFESTFSNSTVGATAVGLFAATSAQASTSSQAFNASNNKKSPQVLILDLILRPTVSLEYISSEGGDALLRAVGVELGVPQPGLVISGVYLGDSEEQLSVPTTAKSNKNAFVDMSLWSQVDVEEIQKTRISASSVEEGTGNNFIIVRCLILERLWIPPSSDPAKDKNFEHSFSTEEPVAEPLRDRLPQILNASSSPCILNLRAAWAEIVGATQLDLVSVSGHLPVIPGFGRPARAPTVVELNSAAAARESESDVYLEEGRFIYSAWDANMIRGCACDLFAIRSAGRFAGNYARPTASFDCSHFRCPLGADPQEASSVNRESNVPRDVFSITCSAGAGRIRFALQGTWTRWLNFDASVADVDTQADEYISGGLNFESALRSINSSVPFVVSWGIDADVAAEAEEDGLLASDVRSLSRASEESMTGLANEKSRQLCNEDGNNTFFVIFLGGGLNADDSLGSLAAQMDDLAAGTLGDVMIREVSRAGQERRYECNRRGTCDRTNGACKCEPGYGSSDGQGRSGQLGDCGVKVFFPRA